MIIQRISKGIKEQDWFVVGVEVMIVVVGIFIGLQVDDWNEERKNRVKEIINLERILLDMEQSITQQQNDLEFMRSNKLAFDFVIDRLEEGILDDDQVIEFETGLWRGTRSNPITFINITIQEMQSTGEIGIIQDLSIRKAIGFINSRYNAENIRLSYAREVMADARNTFYNYAFASQPRSDPFRKASYNFAEMVNSPRVLRASLVMQSRYETLIYFHGLFHKDSKEFKDKVSNYLKLLKED